MRHENYIEKLRLMPRAGLIHELIGYVYTAVIDNALVEDDIDSARIVEDALQDYTPEVVAIIAGGNPDELDELRKTALHHLVVQLQKELDR